MTRTRYADPRFDISSRRQRRAAPDAAARTSAKPPSRNTIALRLPFAGPSLVWMGRIYIALLFLVPSTALDLVGYDYSSIGGSQITKIHISTYWEVVLFLAFVASYPRKADLLRFYLAARPGSLFFLAASTFAFVNILVGKRNGFGMYVDTDLQLALCSLLLPFASPAEMHRLESFLHVFFLINALIALVEFATGWHPFPLTTFSPDGYSFVEPRATALLSHPLHAATVTCVYLISLLFGMGRFPRPWMRGAMMGLQFGALIFFGGRTAFALSGVVILLMSVWSGLRFLTGAKVSRAQVALIAAAVPVAVLVLASAGALGVFDPFIQRFADDGGSARTRLLIWPLLMSFKTGDMLWGAPTDLVFSNIVSYGLEWGVENPFVQMAVYQGVIVASLIMLGILLLLFDNWRALTPKSAYAMATFLLLCNGFGSFGGRFFTFSIFLVVVATLFRRNEETAPQRRPFSGRREPL